MTSDSQADQPSPREEVQNGLTGKPFPAHTSSWVAALRKHHTTEKNAIALYVASHVIKYGMCIYMGPGTTNNALAERIFSRQIEEQRPLDLVILTNNFTIVFSGADKAAKFPEIFSTMQIIITGGTYHSSTNTAAGRFAAKAVESKVLVPHVVLLGAAGVSFEGPGGILAYHFEQELDAQIAFATCPTQHRILACDHSKLGRAERWHGPSIDRLLENTPKCTILTSCPTKGDASEDKGFDAQLEKFISLLKSFIDERKPQPTELALQIVTEGGEVVGEISPSSLKKPEWRRKAARRRRE